MAHDKYESPLATRNASDEMVEVTIAPIPRSKPVRATTIAA